MIRHGITWVPGSSSFGEEHMSSRLLFSLTRVLSLTLDPALQDISDCGATEASYDTRAYTRCDVLSHGATPFPKLASSNSSESWPLEPRVRRIHPRSEETMFDIGAYVTSMSNAQSTACKSGALQHVVGWRGVEATCVMRNLQSRSPAITFLLNSPPPC